MDCRIVPLTDYRFIAVQGPDASKFLQGQLTGDLRAIDQGASTLAAHCTHQGRMVSSFRIARLAEDSYWLRVHAGIAERALAQISKYIVFSKAKARLADDAGGMAVLGADAGRWLQQQGLPVPDAMDTALRTPQGVVIRAPGNAFECWLDTASIARLLEQAGEGRDPPLRWQQYLVEQGLGEVRAETVEALIPQLINLQFTGGICFTKGCYTGQEVIARMKYRGKLKRHMYRARVLASDDVAPNTPVFAPGHEQSVGDVVLSAADGKGVALLVSMTREAKEAGTVHLGSADGPLLEFLPLPYDPEADD